MKPTNYRIQKNAAYKLSRHQMNYEKHAHPGQGEGHYSHKNHYGHHEGHSAVDNTFKAVHLVQLAGILTPVVVSHFVKDTEKQWRAVRLASIITAVVTGGLWEAHNLKRKHEKAEHDDWVSRVCDELGKCGMQPGPGL